MHSQSVSPTDEGVSFRLMSSGHTEVCRPVEIRLKAPKLAMKDSKQAKQPKTARELEAMILNDLRNMDGCPQSGITVTVYGLPWKAMLMFGPAAGPVRNKTELQAFFEIITKRLQRLYEVV